MMYLLKVMIFHGHVSQNSQVWSGGDAEQRPGTPGREFPGLWPLRLRGRRACARDSEGFSMVGFHGYPLVMSKVCY